MVDDCKIFLIMQSIVRKIFVLKNFKKNLHLDLKKIPDQSIRKTLNQFSTQFQNQNSRSNITKTWIRPFPLTVVNPHLCRKSGHIPAPIHQSSSAAFLFSTSLKFIQPHCSTLSGPRIGKILVSEKKWLQKPAMMIRKIVRLRKEAQIKDFVNPGVLRGVLDGIRACRGPRLESPYFQDLRILMVTSPPDKQILRRKKYILYNGPYTAAKALFTAPFFYRLLVCGFFRGQCNSATARFFRAYY